MVNDWITITRQSVAHLARLLTLRSPSAVRKSFDLFDVARGFGRLSALQYLPEENSELKAPRPVRILLPYDPGSRWRCLPHALGGRTSP